MASADLYEALDRAAALELATTVYRHISPDRDCRSGEGARAFGGRWNPPRSYPAIYTALTPYVAYQEMARRATLQKVAIKDLLPRTLCVLAVRLSRVLDLSTESALTIVALDLRDVSGPDASKCQEVGDAAHRLGFEGILVPSATGAGDNLVIHPLTLSPRSTIDEEDTISWATLTDLPKLS